MASRNGHAEVEQGIGAVILVTGTNGFVGQALCGELRLRYFQVRAVLRKPQALLPESEQTIIPAIDGCTDWSAALQGVDVVIHLAARVHVMHEEAADPLAEFRRVNVEGTANLARQAAQAGVKRLVYVSSVKVNGESTLSPNLTPANGEGGQNVFAETDIPSPQDPYGVSKWEAEQALHRVAAETGLEVVIVRPPLVYGAGVKGNFVQMLRVLERGIPLPLASIRNWRSLIYLGNLVDALILCATHPAAAGQTYLVSDGEDVSTSDLLRWLGEAMGCPARLFPCPVTLLRLAGWLIGRTEQVERLAGSLRVDSGKIRRELGWAPPLSMAEGFRATVGWFRGKGKS